MPRALKCYLLHCTDPETVLQMIPEKLYPKQMLLPIRGPRYDVNQVNLEIVKKYQVGSHVLFPQASTCAHLVLLQDPSHDFPAPPSWLGQPTQTSGSALVYHNLGNDMQSEDYVTPAASFISSSSSPPRLTIITSTTDIPHFPAQLPIVKSPVRSRSKAAQRLFTLSTTDRGRKATSFYFSESDLSDSDSGTSSRGNSRRNVVSSVPEEDEKELEKGEDPGSDDSVDIMGQTPLLTPLSQAEEDHSAITLRAEQSSHLPSHSSASALTSGRSPAYGRITAHRTALRVQSPCTYTPSGRMPSSTLIGEPLIPPDQLVRRALPRLILNTSRLQCSFARNTVTTNIRHNASFPSSQYTRPGLSLSSVHHSSLPSLRVVSPDDTLLETRSIVPLEPPLLESNGDTSFETGMQTPDSPDIPSADDMIPDPPVWHVERPSGSHDDVLFGDLPAPSTVLSMDAISKISPPSPTARGSVGAPASVPQVLVDLPSPSRKQHTSIPSTSSLPSHERRPPAGAPAPLLTLMISNGPIPRLPLDDLSPIASRLPHRQGSAWFESPLLGSGNDSVNEGDSKTLLNPNTLSDTPFVNSNLANTPGDSPLFSSISTLPLTSPGSESNKSWLGIDDQVEANSRSWSIRLVETKC